MSNHDYSYDACLHGSMTKAWTVDDCFRGRDFDFTKPFLPERIAGVTRIGCLDDDGRRMLNQIRCSTATATSSRSSRSTSCRSSSTEPAPTYMATRRGRGRCCASARRS